MARFTGMVQFAKILQYRQKLSFHCDGHYLDPGGDQMHSLALTELHRTQKCFGITLIILVEGELEAFPIKILIIRVIDLESGWDGVLCWIGVNTDKK